MLCCCPQGKSELQSRCWALDELTEQEEKKREKRREKKRRRLKVHLARDRREERKRKEPGAEWHEGTSGHET